MKRLILYNIVFVLVFSGCLWPFGVNKSLAHRDEGDGISLEVLDQDAVARAEKVYMMPFAPGVDAAAGVELDRFSLLLVKGLSDGLNKAKRFVLVSGDDASKADIIIKGHIEQFKVLGTFKKKAVIAIRGDLRSASTGQVVALIYARREVNDPRLAVDNEFYNIGVAVAGRLSQ